MGRPPITTPTRATTTVATKQLRNAQPAPGSASPMNQSVRGAISGRCAGARRGRAVVHPRPRSLNSCILRRAVTSVEISALDSFEHYRQVQQTFVRPQERAGARGGSIRTGHDSTVGVTSFPPQGRRSSSCREAVTSCVEAPCADRDEPDRSRSPTDFPSPRAVERKRIRPTGCADARERVILRSTYGPSGSTCCLADV